MLRIFVREVIFLGRWHVCAAVVAGDSIPEWCWWEIPGGRYLPMKAAKLRHCKMFIP